MNWLLREAWTALLCCDPFLLYALRVNTIEDALKAYEDGKITLWQAAERCNLSLWEIILEIKHRRILSSYDMKALEKDLAALNG